MNLVPALLNTAVFPLTQLAVAWIFVRIPDRFFETRRTAIPGDTESRIYREVFRVRRWKGLLPSGGRWVGSSFDYAAALREGAPGRRQFLLETRRSEASHWCSLLAPALLFPWNPPWACAVIAAASLAFNGPCLLVQRYNRAVLLRAEATKTSAPVRHAD